MSKKMNQKNNYSIRNVLLVIIIILFAIIIYLLFRNDKINTIPLIPTGNIDVFEFDCDCPVWEKCTEEKKPAPVSKPELDSNIVKKPNIDNKIPSENEEAIDGFNIFDNQTHWQLESKLRIFTHPSYELAEYIAPGYSNTYEYRVRNNNDFKVLYNMKFKEVNDNNINMKYRLKKNGVYISGTDDLWVSYSDLNKSSVMINANEYDTYLLDWKWIEGTHEKDTAYGLSDMEITYGLTIEIEGIQYENN